MKPAQLAALTLITMIAFAANSLLCRLALQHTSIDAASFTTIRLVSGALVLWLITQSLRRGASGQGNWMSACMLFAYAAGFSYAYISLTVATGALLLFGAVQATMIGYGLFKGQKLSGRQYVGLFLAMGGLVGLLLPGLSAPPLLGSALMLIAGVAWGVYSLRGQGAGDPTRVTAGNFWRAAILAMLLSLLLRSGAQVDTAGALYAIASGAIASGLGYALWYAVLPALRAATAATVQLSVPAIAAFGGIVLLGEALTLRVLLASAAILGGIALVIAGKRQAKQAQSAVSHTHPATRD